jgi:hypothetical protein
VNQKTYEDVTRALLDEANGIETAKRPGYTLGNEDVLKNFKAVAARAGITPEQAWTVYFLKHIDAITAVMTRPELPVSEAPLGRFSDAINYLKLGWALLQENADTTRFKPTP